MSNMGLLGTVKFLIAARLAEYGDSGPDWALSSGEDAAGGPAGPTRTLLASSG